jgi:glycosyltransferase involved in cell wall biosynthesis
MARIGIDASHVAPDGKGHSRTQLQLVEALADLGTGHELAAFVRPAGAALLPPGVEAVPLRGRPTVVWELAGLPLAVQERRLDLVLTLSERLPPACRAPIVVWLFEAPTHRIEENRRRGAGAYQRAADLATGTLWKGSLRRAARVAAGSDATAREIAAAVPSLAGRVDVVYPGLAEGFSPGPGADGRYVLHLSSADPRDNSLVALAAFAEARGRSAEPVRLVVAGSLGVAASELERERDRLDLGGAVELRGRVSDDELVSLYRGAAAYLDATLYEGFGYQALEAMACGAPVVASSATSIPEVVGDAGLLADPRSPGALADALVEVLEEPGLADELRRRGLERAAAFTWERTARTFARIMDEVLRSRGSEGEVLG